MKLFDFLRNPSDFLENTRSESWRPALSFFLAITAAVAVATPIVNYLGIESTDLSSAYQAQILAFRLSKPMLAQYGMCTYVIEALLILGIATLYVLFLTGFIHLIYRAIGGKGTVLNAWKTSCYGIAPCLLGGFLPYISLFAGAYSLLLQLYVGPKTLYRVKESRATVFLAVILALTFIEMLTAGTTVGLLL